MLQSRKAASPVPFMKFTYQQGPIPIIKGSVVQGQIGLHVTGEQTRADSGIRRPGYVGDQGAVLGGAICMNHHEMHENS